jgi:hypothetical protein
MNADVPRGGGLPPLAGLCGAGRVWGWRPGTPYRAPGPGPDRCLDLRRSHDVWPVQAGAFGPRRPSLAPCSLNIVCEVIEGAGPNGVPGRPGAGRKG